MISNASPAGNTGSQGSSTASAEQPLLSQAQRRQLRAATRGYPAPQPPRLAIYGVHEDTSHRQAELFYLQKQIQTHTHMVFVLEDGTQVEGVIEWYDRNSLKVRGREKLLLYKSAIKYMHKADETGHAF